MTESVRHGEPSRVERKRAERVARVERTAARVFAQRGYDGANLDEIAAQLDMRGPSLYHYFSSKEELFLRCVAGSAAEVISRLERVAASAASGVERLRLLFREQVLIEVRDYPDFLPLFHKVHPPVVELRARLLDLRREHEAVFKRVAEEARAAQGLDRTAARVALFVAFGALSYLQEWYDPDGPMGPEELADRVADTLIEPFRSSADGAAATARPGQCFDPASRSQAPPFEGGGPVRRPLA